MERKYLQFSNDASSTASGKRNVFCNFPQAIKEKKGTVANLAHKIQYFRSKSTVFFNVLTVTSNK